jgi:phage terminase large subunit-like protein
MKHITKRFEKFIVDINTVLDDGSQLTEEQLNDKWCYENSFYLFVEKAWHICDPGSPFVHGWHIQAICEHLEALYKLDINRLLINIPPRMGKSQICAILYPAWVWAKNPSLSFLFSSYAHNLALRDSVKCRRLVQSPWYQALWGHTFALTGDVNNKIRFDNTKGGYRLITSVGGMATGEGASFEVEDDPNNVRDVESEVIRESTNDWHDFSMSQRYAGSYDQFRRLVIQQRTHWRDVSGNILAKDDKRWIHLCLPMEFEKANRCITIPLRMSKGIVWRDPRTKEGEPLSPARFNTDQLYELKQKDYRGNEYHIAGQLQQRPSPSRGGIIKADWFQHWKERSLPSIEYTLQSWDTAMASPKKGNRGSHVCYSACTTWGIFSDHTDTKNIILLSIYKGKVEYPDLKKMAIRLAHNYYDTDFEDPIAGPYGMEKSAYMPDLVLIESQMSGYTLVSDLMRTTIPVMRFNPRTDPGGGDNKKVNRMQRVSDLIENGKVWLPCDYPNYYPNEYSQVLINDCIMFPSGESNDTIDSMSQAFIRLKQTGWIYHSADYNPVQETDWRQYEKEDSFRKSLRARETLWGGNQ